MRKISLLFLFIFSLFLPALFAQTKPRPKPTPTPAEAETEIDYEAPSVRTVGRVSSSGGGVEDEDEGKITGATIRGKVVYEDTGRPLRFVAIGFVKSGDDNTYSTKFVKTDENGDFVIKNVKPGTFLPVIKADGILNPTSYTNQLRQSDKKAEVENMFEKTEVAGLGEFQVLIRAKRGGSITGRVNYSDGEVAVGVKVEALIKNNNRFQQTSFGDFSVGTATTDDRGFYRFAGLPEGKYIVRVIEPVSHKETKMPLWEATRSGYGQESQMLTTYYPDTEKSDKATQLEVSIGQEQSDINFNLPERKLFRVAGKVIAKSNEQPLKNFDVIFIRLKEPENSADKNETTVIANSSAISIKTDSAGNWALRSLLKGKYQIQISEGYVYRNPNVQTTEKPVNYPAITKEIEITDKDISELVIEIPSESSISGVFLTEDGKPLPKGFSVYASSGDGKGFGTSHDYKEENADPNKPKTFRIGKLVEGKYNILSGEQEYYIKSIKIGGSVVSAIEVKEGEEVKNVQIVLSNQTGTLKGKVDGYNSKERAFIFLIKSGSTFENIRGDDNKRGIVNPKGEFEIKSKDGEYSVLLITEKTAPKTQAEAKEWFEREIKNAPKVEIIIGEISNITLKMPND